MLRSHFWKPLRMSDSARSNHAPHFVLTHEGSLHGEDTAKNREIVRRIHACVNACDGISTEELERGIIRDMRRVLAQVVPLLQERNEQAAAEVDRPESRDSTNSAHDTNQRQSSD